MQDLQYRKLQNEFDKIFSLPPNDLGNKWLTYLYGFFAHPLKKMPFIYILPLSLVGAIVLYVLLG
ncbi:MAG TPA: hypothetical protein PLS49_04660, partial [Candidatus Woesebacteria bacterium]|nr:hypothetical protein [Candidatus Woesebacteria bacterium]